MLTVFVTGRSVEAVTQFRWTLIFLQQHELYSAPVRTNFFFYRMHSHVVLVPARSTGQRRLRHVQLQ